MQFYLINDGNFRVAERIGDANQQLVSTLLGCRQLLIKTDQAVILVDTGIGLKRFTKSYFDKFTISQPRQLLSALEIAGINAELVTKLVFTHLHFDHAGGFSYLDQDASSQVVFPNAEILLQQKELDYAYEQMLLEGNSYTEENLNKIFNSPNLHILNGNYDLTPQISILTAYGHSAGNQMLRFIDENMIYYFAGDLLPTPYHVNITKNPPGIDLDPELHFKNKTKLLDNALKENAIIILNHSPAITAVRINGCIGGKYEFKSVKLKEIPAWTIL